MPYNKADDIDFSPINYEILDTHCEISDYTFEPYQHVLLNWNKPASCLQDSIREWLDENLKDEWWYYSKCVLKDGVWLYSGVCICVNDVEAMMWFKLAVEV